MEEQYQQISRQIFYELLARQVQSLLEDERDPIANMANVSALLWEAMDNINWVGFYRLLDNELVLGPFQGKAACVRIPMGKGVCGASAEHKQTMTVADVHQFSEHITCDSASNSEIVIPIIKNGKMFGVLDVDSPLLARFDAQDKAGLEKIVEIFAELTEL